VIIAYAQATDRQGLDAAVNGEAVDQDHDGFTDLRERAKELNNQANSIRISGVELNYARGVARLVLDGSDDEHGGSPITVVAKFDAVVKNPDEATRVAAASVRAIGRECDESAIRDALAMAVQLHDSYLTKRSILVAGGIAVVAGIVVTAAVIASSYLSRR
jgi:hypothetical protein